MNEVLDSEEFLGHELTKHMRIQGVDGPKTSRELVDEKFDELSDIYSLEVDEAFEGENNEPRHVIRCETVIYAIHYVQYIEA